MRIKKQKNLNYYKRKYCCQTKNYTSLPDNITEQYAYVNQYSKILATSFSGSISQISCFRQDEVLLHRYWDLPSWSGSCGCEAAALPASLAAGTTSLRLASMPRDGAACVPCTSLASISDMIMMFCPPMSRPLITVTNVITPEGYKPKILLPSNTIRPWLSQQSLLQLGPLLTPDMTSNLSYLDCDTRFNFLWSKFRFKLLKSPGRPLHG